jgi:hypothetical protein
MSDLKAAGPRCRWRPHQLRHDAQSALAHLLGDQCQHRADRQLAGDRRGLRCRLKSGSEEALQVGDRALAPLQRPAPDTKHLDRLEAIAPLQSDLSLEPRQVEPPGEAFSIEPADPVAEGYLEPLFEA